MDVEDRVNLAPYSFFGAFHSRPPIVGFSSEGYKDSVCNVERSGEFVCNLATRDLAAAMNETSRPLAAGEDEMALAGLAAAASVRVRPPRVAAAPAALECRLLQIVKLADLDGQQVGSFPAQGQVVGVRIDPAFLRDGRFDMAAARPITRCGYRGDYAEAGAMFEMLRPGA